MSPAVGFPTPKRFRSLFLSDLHLGAHGCQADKILSFLSDHHAEFIYLVGDIFDLGRRRPVHWTPQHDAIIELLAQRLQQGVKVVRLPGNHDPLLTPADPDSRTARLPSTAHSVIHQAADHRRYLITHGDCCDFWLGRSHFMSRLGSYIDSKLRRWSEKHPQAKVPEKAPKMQRLLGKINHWMTWGGLIEQRLVALARSQGMDGIVCGHLHQSALSEHDGTLYANCGDWVDSLCALVEDRRGNLSLVDWQGEPLLQPACPLAALDDIESSSKGIA